jgi:ADP-heptose:LPS heptosyltransferase
MQIFSSEHGLTTQECFFLPYCRYVVPESVGRSLESGLLAKHPDAHYTLSNFNSYERRYAGQPMKRGESLLVYRHGAFGDTLMTTAVIAQIRKRNPYASIDLYCRTEGAEMWGGLAVRTLPGYPPFDAARHYTHHLLYENMLECNSEDDQGCAVDDMLSFAGIDPASVPDAEKLPVVYPTDKDLEGAPRIAAPRYIVIQRNSSNPNRTYPHALELEARMGKLLPTFVVGDKDERPVHPTVTDLRGFTKRFRNLIPIVRKASLVVCPDSSVGHLAAAFPEVPVISLWGLFHPNDRAKYYRNHHPLFVPEACPHAPCRSHLFTLPFNQCRDAADWSGTSCAALAAITPEMVEEKAREILAI